jgi:hypothetical protein
VTGAYWYGEEFLSSINAGNFFTSCKVYWLASQEGLCSMELVIGYLGTLVGDSIVAGPRTRH